MFVYEAFVTTSLAQTLYSSKIWSDVVRERGTGEGRLGKGKGALGVGGGKGIGDWGRGERERRNTSNIIYILINYNVHSLLGVFVLGNLGGGE